MNNNINNKYKLNTNKLIKFIFLVLFIFIIYIVSQISNIQDTQTHNELYDAITRSCVHAYANTGSYPESIKQIEQQYKINIDRTKFIVDYEVFASNIMPKITIIRK